jgi:hypothetical protein
MVPEHRTAFVDAVSGDGGSGVRGDRFSRSFPNLHYVWIDGTHPSDRSASDEWKEWLAQTDRPIIRVAAADLIRHPERAARAVVRALLRSKVRAGTFASSVNRC